MKKHVLLLSITILNLTISVSAEVAASKPATGPTSKEIVQHAELMQELKRIANEKIKKAKPQPSTQKSPHKYTQTESYIRAVNDDYGQITPQLLNAYIDSFLAYAETTDWNTYEPILIKMFENEKKYPSDYVFYHAYKKELGLVFDVYKELFDLLAISAGSDQTVLIRDIMKPREYQYRTVNEFIDFWITTQFYKDQITARIKRPEDSRLGGWNDSKDPLRALILSANISLFGNAYDLHSSSLYYFVHSQSYTDTAHLLGSFFKIWKFDEKYIQELDNLQKLVADSESGHMLQIFIPRELVNDTVYISAIFGAPWPTKITNTYNEQKKRHMDTLSILDLYRSNPLSITTEVGIYDYNEYLQTPENERMGPPFLNTASKFSIDVLQARILLTPQLFDPTSNVKMFRFSLTPEKNLAEYKKRLKIIVKNMLSDWLNDPKNQDYFKKLNVPLSKLADYIKQGEALKQ